MVRIDPTADDSLAAMRARSKFGMAIAAMIRMMATTISNSISEKPFCLRILRTFSLREFCDPCSDLRFLLHALGHEPGPSCRVDWPPQGVCFQWETQNPRLQRVRKTSGIEHLKCHE